MAKAKATVRRKRTTKRPPIAKTPGCACFPASGGPYLAVWDGFNATALPIPQTGSWHLSVVGGVIGWAAGA